MSSGNKQTFSPFYGISVRIGKKPPISKDSIINCTALRHRNNLNEKLLTFVKQLQNQSDMDRTAIKDLRFPECPIRNILARISDKWSLLVLFLLHQNGTMRFKSLQRALPDISPKMLTVTLRMLEEDGFVLRKVYPEVPPHVEYTLTSRAESLLPHVDRLIDWAAEHQAEILKDREAARKQ